MAFADGPVSVLLVVCFRRLPAGPVRPRYQPRVPDERQLARIGILADPRDVLARRERHQTIDGVPAGEDLAEYGIAAVELRELAQGDVELRAVRFAPGVDDVRHARHGDGAFFVLALDL